MNIILTAEEFLVKMNIFEKPEISNFNLILHRDSHIQTQKNIKNAMIEFAKLHVEAALQQASEKSNLQHQYGYGYYDDQSTKEFIIENKYEKNTHGHGDCGYDIIFVNKDSIINAYPLDQIK